MQEKGRSYNNPIYLDLLCSAMYIPQKNQKLPLMSLAFDLNSRYIAGKYLYGICLLFKNGDLTFSNVSPDKTAYSILDIPLFIFTANAIIIFFLIGI